MENQIKKSESTSVNLSNAKINLKKGNQKILSENQKSSASTTRKSLYVGMEKLGTEEQKTFRGKIRRDLKNFVKQIFGKDRTDNEKETGIIEFLDFYKTHWKITDFKIENFSNSKNPVDLKDYKALLDFVKSTLE